MSRPAAIGAVGGRYPKVQRRIALVAGAESTASGEGPTEHAMRLFDTMLWVLKGTTRESWATAMPAEADIVVIHRGTDPALAAIWKARGKLVVEITTEADAADDDENVLAYPFPPQRVLDLLEKLSARLGGSAVATQAKPQSIEKSAARVNADRWSLAEALRILRAVRNDNIWMIARDGEDPVIWLRGDGSAYFAAESLLRTLRVDPALTTRLELRNGYPPTKARVIERPGMEFFWLAGFNAGEEFAPWLNATGRYRVTSWPDFGLIRPESAVLRVVALLAAEPIELTKLAARARVSAAFASRVCNALALCEVLAVAGPLPERSHAGARRPAPFRGFAGFVRRIRGHLGLAVAP